MNIEFRLYAGLALALAVCSGAMAQTVGSGFDARLECNQCPRWNAEQAPIRLAPNTWYVGSRGLSSVLINTQDGLILIDGGLPQSAAQIATHIRQLGFDPSQIRYLLNSHAHFDHAGGIAALAALSGATVVSSPDGLAALRSGIGSSSDPQAGFGAKSGFPPLPPGQPTRSVASGEVLTLGKTEILAEYTPGHAPGGMSWRWRACDAKQACVNVVYADSLNAVSDPDYRFSDHPEVVTSLSSSIERVAGFDCDLLISVHPEQSQLFERAAEQRLIDPEACRRYAGQAAQALSRRLQQEREASSE